LCAREAETQFQSSKLWNTPLLPMNEQLLLTRLDSISESLAKLAAATGANTTKLQDLDKKVEANTTQLQSLDKKFQELDKKVEANTTQLQSLDKKVEVNTKKLQTVVDCVGLLAENQIRFKVQEMFGKDFGNRLRLKSLFQLAEFFVSAKRAPQGSDSDPAEVLQKSVGTLLKMLNSVFYNSFLLLLCQYLMNFFSQIETLSIFFFNEF
jgi:DNA repair exonuclease SbcCD ATPase subunit